ncbi:MAG: toxin PIN [Prevotella sp.]|nr:toxin PIN [Prevotella sp.]
MKKVYIKPEITVIEMQMDCSILAGSLGNGSSLGVSDAPQDGSRFNANRRKSVWDDEDDELF